MLKASAISVQASQLFCTLASDQPQFSSRRASIAGPSRVIIPDVFNDLECGQRTSSCNTPAISARSITVRQPHDIPSNVVLMDGPIVLIKGNLSLNGKQHRMRDCQEPIHLHPVAEMQLFGCTLHSADMQQAAMFHGKSAACA